MLSLYNYEFNFRVSLDISVGVHRIHTFWIKPSVLSVFFRFLPQAQPVLWNIQIITMSHCASLYLQNVYSNSFFKRSVTHKDVTTFLLNCCCKELLPVNHICSCVVFFFFCSKIKYRSGFLKSWSTATCCEMISLRVIYL